MQKRIWIYFLFLILLLHQIKAATVHGDVYDFELNKLTNVVVEIDTTPKQSFIIKDGGYFFNVPLGKYTIGASLVQKGEVVASVREEILVVDANGDYTLDLILFPSLDENGIFNSSDIDINLGKERSNAIYIYIAFIILLGIAAFFVLRALQAKKRQPIPEDHSLIEVATQKEELKQDETLSKVLEIVKQSDGRTTQKEIRKALNLSEAKISLVITQLEAEKKIKKIKKGRGNIIILNK